MALLTMGTNSTTSLKAFAWSGNPAHLADVATLNSQILNDQTHGPVGLQATWPESFSRAGNILHIPNRGVLKILPGDFIAYDVASGWPILVSGLAITNGSSVWTHS